MMLRIFLALLCYLSPTKEGRRGGAAAEHMMLYKKKNLILKTTEPAENFDTQGVVEDKNRKQRLLTWWLLTVNLGSSH